MPVTKVTNHIDLVLFLALVAFGWYVLAFRPWGISHDQAAAAGLAGALFGGAALLLGNWINRVSDRLKAAQEQADQVEKLKAMIAAELVDVACGLMSAKQLVDVERGSQAYRGSGNLQVFQSQVDELGRLHRQWLSDLDSFKSTLRAQGVEPKALKYVDEALGLLVERVRQLAA